MFRLMLDLLIKGAELSSRLTHFQSYRGKRAGGFVLFFDA